MKPLPHPSGPSVAHRLGLIDPSIVQIHMTAAMCLNACHTLRGFLKNMNMEAFRYHLFASVHLPAGKIATGCFHYYENHFLEQVRPQKTTVVRVCIYTSVTHAQAYTQMCGTFFVQVHISIWLVMELDAGWPGGWLAGWLAGGLLACWLAGGWARCLAG